MNGWYPVFRKELANFFVSPIAYLVIAGFALVSGFFFWANVSFFSLISLQAANQPMVMEQLNLTDMVIRPLVQNMSIMLLILMPLLSMRLFSEEKRSGTIELLLTYPLSDGGIIAGKFLASWLFLLIMLASTVPFTALTFRLGDPDIGPYVCGYLGLLLMGGAFMSLGMTVSSLTENQIVSAALTFTAAILFWVLSWTASFTGPSMGAVIRQLSILEHLDSFNKGIVSLSDVSFFIFFMAFFLFLTARSLESNRWRG